MSYEITPQPQLRALDVLDVVPAGCVAVVDDTGLCEPHIRIGEFAIADTTDRDPIKGEIFAIRWKEGGRISILQARVMECDIGDGPQPTWWVGPMPGARIAATSEGPFSDNEHLKSKIVGRIVGVMAAQVAG